ncbi:hypothetical protein Tco_0088017 [Tanacetum coccineum]
MNSHIKANSVDSFKQGRQILDGPFILNEIVSWCKSRKEQALFSKWRGWIRGCLHSLKDSVLVNGLPTDEFLFYRGLRQRDLTWHFILVMESLHVAFQGVIDRGMFVLILVGKNDFVPISHLFDANDAMFIVNVHKSSLYGLGVHSLDIQSMANSFGCLANNILFTYLSVKVAATMARINSWNKVIQKVTINLSTWKAKSLSVGGRLTLLKSVLGSLPTYYVSLFKAPGGVLSHLERLVFGLASSKLFTALMALLISFPRHVPVVSFGSRFIKQSLVLNLRAWIFWGFAKKVIGNANNSNFWYDKWLIDVCFKVKFNMLFNLDLQKDALVAQKFQNPDFAVSFRRSPRGGIEESQFQGLFLSCFLRLLYPLPVIVGLRPPTRINLSIRGLDVTCVLCSNCGNDVESRNHLFFDCSMALNLFRLLGRWWNIDIINPFLGNHGLMVFGSTTSKSLPWNPWFFSMWWHIWKYRNAILFSLKKPIKGLIFDNIVSQTGFGLTIDVGLHHGIKEGISSVFMLDSFGACRSAASKRRRLRQKMIV